MFDCVALVLTCTIVITSNSDAIELCSGVGITEPSAVAPGQSNSRVRIGEIDPALPRSVLLSSEQLAFDCGNLRVNHAEAVQLTAALEGNVLYMIGKYFRLG